MKTNLGSFDRAARLVIGVILIFAPLLNFLSIWASAGLAYTSIGIGLILIATALIRFCPIYRVVGVSTCKH